MSAPHTLEDSLRVHDAAFVTWLGGLHVDYPVDPDGNWDQRLDSPIIIVNVPPSRVFASVVDTLVRVGWFKTEATAAAMRQKAASISVLPLPLATWTRSDPQPDLSLAGTAKTVRFADNPDGSANVQLFPQHYFTDYAVNFWCHKQYTAAFVREWVYSQLGGPGACQTETYIPVVHAPPWGTKIHALRFAGSADQTSIEGFDPPYRRFSFNFSLRTWVMRRPPARTRQVVGAVHLNVQSFPDENGNVSVSEDVTVTPPTP